MAAKLIRRLTTFLALRPLHLLALASLAVAQPLFDLLGRTPELFVARGVTPGGLWLLTALLFFGPPLLLAAMAELCGLLGRSARTVGYQLGLGLLAALFILLALQRYESWPGMLRIAIALLLAAGCAWAYGRYENVRLLLTILVPLCFFVPLAFLFLTPVRGLLQAATDAPSPAVSAPAAKPVPAVFVVFDELPLTSLLDRNGQVDAQLFPHFAALAATSTWYRHASANASLTLTALPSLLTGRYPRPDLLPTRRDHPENLFTLLAPTHDLHVLEPRTSLAPPRASRQTKADNTMASLLRDLGIVYLHLVLPQDTTGWLPDITTTWGNYGRAPDKASAFRELIAEIEPGSRPPLVFAHVELPHHPWIYLPSGKRYHPGGEMFMDGLALDRGPANDRWVDDEWAVTQAEQRHLLQLAFVDRLLGELVDRLKAADLFIPALIIVTADHGISFEPGGRVRAPDEASYPDIVSVPLFIKYPDQEEARIDDRATELVDLLPTLAGFLDIAPVGPFDGRSLLAADNGRQRQRYVFHSPEQSLRLTDPTLAGRQASLDRKLRRFGGPQAERTTPYHTGPHPELLGQSLGTLTIGGASNLGADLPQLDDLANLDPDAPLLPARLSGRLQGALRENPAALALALDGTVRATTFTAASDPSRFAFMIPEDAFHRGAHDVALFLIRETDTGPHLAPITTAPPRHYTLLANDKAGEPIIRADDGATYRLDPTLYEGHAIDVLFKHRAFRVELVGWAQDEASGEIPDRIVVFTDGTSRHTGGLNLDNPKLRDRYKIPGHEGAAFLYFLPTEDLSGDVRLFALSDQRGAASELEYEKQLEPREHPAF